MNMNRITEPTLLLDEQKCRANIRRMADKAERYGLHFKPHFKTHQSAEIGRWFQEAGVRAITVSSIPMAAYFARNGWNDITIAFPVNPRSLKQINTLAQNIRLSLLVNELSVVQLLDRQMEHQVNAYIEVDTGSGRTGIKSTETARLSRLVDAITDAQSIDFSGFYSHPGHSYSCRNKMEISEVHSSVLGQMQKIREQFKHYSGTYSVCIGDTPTCSIAEGYEGIDEISPGNFVFYDLMQTQITSCTTDQIAVALACPVVGKYKQRKELVVHAGAVHLSKEQIQQNTTTHFGLPVLLNTSGWGDPVSGSFVKALSQEHGIISCSDALFNRVNIGDLVGILPVHSCLTASLTDSYTTLQGRNISK